jgi:hypothetical protein
MKLKKLDTIPKIIFFIVIAFAISNTYDAFKVTTWLGISVGLVWSAILIATYLDTALERPDEEK